MAKKERYLKVTKAQFAKWLAGFSPRRKYDYIEPRACLISQFLGIKPVTGDLTAATFNTKDHVGPCFAVLGGKLYRIPKWLYRVAIGDSNSLKPEKGWTFGKALARCNAEMSADELYVLDAGR